MKKVGAEPEMQTWPISSHPRSVAVAPNMAGMANQAYRPWGGGHMRFMCAVAVAADAHHDRQRSGTTHRRRVVP
jgi:hypothetical protein